MAERNHVSFPSDYGPEEPRLHLLRSDDGDIIVVVAPGERYPFADAFVAAQSGQRDHVVTMTLSMLFAHGQGKHGLVASLAASIAEEVRRG